MKNSRTMTPKGRRLSAHANIDSLGRHGFRDLSEVDDVMIAQQESPVRETAQPSTSRELRGDGDDITSLL